ncbi:MAG: right-handed parallel beta-helix repeat-containing protein [Candidatus Polarisedimenticolia bacterium]
MFVLAASGLFAVVALGGQLEPPGPPAPTMKTIQQVEPRIPISSIPIVIAAPGSYYLTSDLGGVPDQPGIRITSSNVTLDLNGFSLIGGHPFTLEGIQADTVGQIVIRNGAVRDWGGVGISVGPNSTVEDVHLSANLTGGLGAGPQSIVRNVIASSNGQDGIFADAGSMVTGSTASGNGGSGFSLGAGSTATDCTSYGNATGFQLGTGSRVSRSVARQNSVGILSFDGGTIENCTVADNTSYGIYLAGSRCVVRGNTADNNTTAGINAAGHFNRIEDNQSTLNFYGILVDGAANLVVKNSASDNMVPFDITPGNKVGPISTNPATAGPWANFQ